MSELVYFNYNGKALPDNGDVVELFSTVTAFPGAKMFQQMGIARMVLTITNDQSGTLKVYQSQDRGVTWKQIVADAAISAATNDVPNQKDYVVEPFPDWKVTWTNGATVQGKFMVNIAGIFSRNSTT